MLKLLAQIGALAIFVTVVVVLGYILWCSLFPSNEPNNNRHSTNEQYAQRQRADENAKITAQKSVTDEKLATYTLALAIFTGLLVLVAVFQIALLIRADKTTTKAANAAQESADVARDALIASNRPWLTLNVEINGDLTFEAPTGGAGSRWSVPIIYRTENIGNGPAIRADFFAAIIPYIISTVPTDAEGKPTGHPRPATDIPAEIKKVCSFTEHFTGFGFGTIIFPKEPGSHSFILNGNAALFEQAKIDPGYTGQFLVVTCITYRSTLDKSATHRTAKVFNLYKTTGNQRIDLNGEVVPRDRLGFVLTPSNGTDAQ